MPFRKIITNIKEAKQPCYIIREEDEENSHFCFDSKICQEAKRLATLEIHPESPKGTIFEASPILNRITGSTFLKTPEHPSFAQLDKKNIVAQRKQIVKKYYAREQMLKDSKLRSQSLERVQPIELSSFRQYKHILKETKKKCNINLWVLLEQSKLIYKAQMNYPVQNLLIDFACLVFDFVFSSIRRLRFDQCKSDLERLEDIENTVVERLKNQNKSNNLIKQLSPIPSRQSKQTTPQVSTVMSFLDTSKIGKNAPAKRVLGKSMKVVMPGLFEAGSKPKENQMPTLMISRIPSNIDDTILYKKLLVIIRKAKYIMAQIGHLFHYEQLSNPLSDYISSREERRKSFSALISANSVEQNRERPGDSRVFASYSTAHQLNSVPSIDLEGEKLHSARTDTSIFEQIVYSNRLTNFFFESQSLLDDFDEKVVAKRQENLQNYCIYKAKKWFMQKKKKEVQKKYEKFELVCKICEEKVNIDKMKEHSSLCRLKAETNKEMKDLDKKISETVFDAFMRGKELETGLRIDHKKYNKLKDKSDRSRGSTPTGNSSFAKLNANLIKEASVRSPRNVSPSTSSAQKEAFNFLRSKGQRRHNTEYLKEMKDAAGLPRSQSGNTGEVKSCVEQLNKSFGPGQESRSDGSKLGLDEDNKKKTFVERFLQKQNIKYADSPSMDSEDRSDRFFGDLTPPNKRLEANSLCIEDVNLNYYSDPVKSDFESEHSVDSKNTDETKPSDGSVSSLSMQPLKMFESSGASDWVPPNSELSVSDSRSVKSSPLNANKNFTSAYKKSQFYKGNNMFNFGEGEKAYGETEEKEGREETKTSQLGSESQPLVGKSAGELGQDETDEAKHKFFRNINKTHSVYITAENKKDTPSTTRAVNSQATEEMIKLRLEITKKKEIIKIYEIVTRKGKIIVNKEPYQWKMELLREDTNYDIHEILKKVSDDDVKKFAENFLNLLDKRIHSGKVFQETKKLLDQLSGQTPENSSDKLSLDKLSLLRGNNLHVPHRKSILIRSPIERTVKPKVSSNTRKNLRGLIEEDLPTIQLNDRVPSLYPSRDQPTFGEQNDNADDNLSNSSDFDDIQKAFGSINDQRNQERRLSDKSSGKPTENFQEFKSSKGDMTPLSPFSEMSTGNNNFNNFESLKTLGEDEERRKSVSSNQQKDKDQSFEAEPQENSETNQPQNLDISLTEVKPPAENTETKEYLPEIKLNGLMSIDGCLRNELTEEEKQQENQTPSDFRQNVFQMSREGSRRMDEASPETPSFEIKDPPPLIWRTSTAPIRTLKEVKNNVLNRPLKSKNNIKNIMDTLKMNNTNETNSASNTPQKEVSLRVGHAQSFKVNDDDDGDDDEEPPERLSAKNKTLLIAPRHQKQRDLVKMSTFRKKFDNLLPHQAISLIEDSNTQDQNMDQNEVPKSLFASQRKEPPVFAEDIPEQNEFDERCESPILLESPLLHKGYYSDTQIKGVRVTIKKNQTIGMPDFDPIKLISKGAFGTVWLVRRKATNDLYAMKVINLAGKAAKNTQELENLRKENKVFALAQEDFVVRALFTFTYESCICFVMEFMIGGDFGDIIENYGILDEDVARFYIAEIVLALEYLHSLGIVHRDLKPDNILLDKNGHAKLTDFGLSETGLSQKMKNSFFFNEPESPMIYQNKVKALSKLKKDNEPDNKAKLKIKGKVYERKNEQKPKLDDIREREEEEKVLDKEKLKSQEQESSDDNAPTKKKNSKKVHRLIGTPDYMAPEIISGQSITNYSIDWWSLGVMLFEFLVGIPPFNDETPDKIFDNITKLNIPWNQIPIGYEEGNISPEAADLIQKLLVLDPAKRLGATGAQEIKQHKFFEGLDWENLRKQPAPIIPEQKHEADTDNFGRMKEKLSEKDKESPFVLLGTDHKANQSVQVAKELLEATSEKFALFNYAALDSDNMKLVEEAMKEKERALQQLKAQEPDTKGKKIIDDVFDTPK